MLMSCLWKCWMKKESLIEEASQLHVQPLSQGSDFMCRSNNSPQLYCLSNTSFLFSAVNSTIEWAMTCTIANFQLSHTSEFNKTTKVNSLGWFDSQKFESTVKFLFWTETQMRSKNVLFVFVFVLKTSKWHFEPHTSVQLVWTEVRLFFVSICEQVFNQHDRSQLHPHVLRHLFHSASWSDILLLWEAPPEAQEGRFLHNAHTELSFIITWSYIF